MKCKPSKDIKNIIMNIEKNNYKYDRVDYINTKKKAKIYCSKCGKYSYC